MQDRLDPQLDAGDPCRVAGAHTWAREHELEGDPEPGQSATRGAGLMLAALGQAALEIGTAAVSLGVAMAE